MAQAAARPLRVLHVIPAVAPRYGGPALTMRHMAAGLAALGVRVDVATTTADGERDLGMPLGRPVVEDGARYFYFPRQRPRGWTYSAPLARWLRAHAADYDLLHVHGAFTYSTLAACRAARRVGRPYVLEPCGTLNSWGLAQKRWKKLPYYALIERRNLQSAEAIHAASPLEAAELIPLGLGAKVRVIPLSCDLPPLRSRPARPGASPRLLTLSRLHPVKGLPVLFEALALLKAEGGPQVRLTIAGQGEAVYAAQLRAEAAALGLAGQVTFAGFVEGRAKADLLAAADLFVLPSHAENFGLAAAEALAAGLPVIVSDGVGLAEMVREAGAGLVVPAGSAEALGAAIGGLAADAARREAMGRRGRALARREFSLAALSTRLLALYEEVLNSSRGA